MKICKECNQEKELIEFCKRKEEKDGLHRYCKECARKRLKNEYIRDKEFKKQYYILNKQNKIDYQKKYKNNNKTKVDKYNKEWRVKNKKHLNEYIKYRCLNDPTFKLKRNIRSRILMGLKLNNKSFKTENIIGCTFEDCKQYLEKQFKPEMNWSNHGKIWEIDHIIPIFHFDITKEEEQQKCFHHTNLQPLFKTTEIAKQFGYENETGNRNKNRNK